jgi:putative cell wall-binding protein
MAAKAANALGLAKATRVAGTDRFVTCTAVNDTFKTSFTSNELCAATGMDFPDALAGGVYAAKNKAPLFLINGKAAKPALTDKQKAYLKAKGASSITVFGGTSVVPDIYIEKIAEYSV